MSRQIEFFRLDENLPVEGRHIISTSELTSSVFSLDEFKFEFYEEDCTGEERKCIYLNNDFYSEEEYKEVFWFYIDDFNADMFGQFPMYDYELLLKTKEAFLKERVLTTNFRNDEGVDIYYYNAVFHWKGFRWKIHYVWDQFNGMLFLKELD